MIARRNIVPRRKLATAFVAATLGVALATPWPAQAGEHFYEGEVTGFGEGKIEFVLARKHGELKVKDFHADALAWQCSNGNFFEQHFGIRSIAVHQRRFEKKKEIYEDRDSYIAEVEGRLRRGRATGTLRFFSGFDLTPICDTGVLEWKASD